MIRILDYRDARSLLTRKTQRLEEAELVVAPILADVRKRGDAALLEYARKFDGFSGASVRMPVEGSLTPEMQQAVETAAANIREHARTQLPVDGFIEKTVPHPAGIHGVPPSEVIPYKVLPARVRLPRG